MEKSVNGVISVNNEPKAQIQIIEGQDGNRDVRVYSVGGVYLCGMRYEGDDNTGFLLGHALFEGYMAGWDNCQFSISKNVTKALYEIQDNTKI